MRAPGASFAEISRLLKQAETELDALGLPFDRVRRVTGPLIRAQTIAMLQHADHLKAELRARPAPTETRQ